MTSRRRSALARPPRSGRGPARRPRIRLDHEARRAQLLELGLRVFAERTYDEVSIDDLARAAGISKGLLYHYFPTKRDLYLAGLRRISDELLARTEVSAPGLSPVERVRRGVDAYLGFVAGHARHYVALMRGGIGSDPEVLAIVEGVRAALFERMFTGPESPLAALEVRTPTARLALRGWIGFAEAASLDWLTHGDPSQEVVRDLLVELLLPTLRLALEGTGRSSR